MKTYAELRTICKRNSRVTERVVDDFLLSYAAGHQGLEKKIEREFDRFRHVGKQMGKENSNMLIFSLPICLPTWRKRSNSRSIFFSRPW